MSTLLIRTVIIYLLVFGVVRLTGKRQISDMQPFDLVITLLIADLSSTPISDSSTPLLFGIIPILTLFLLHRTVAFLALKSQQIRSLVCGHPIIVISKGVVDEQALKAANYTLNDLIEQMRLKDVFAFSQVEYAILETNGSLSVLKNNSVCDPDAPTALLLSDGKPILTALQAMGLDEIWLQKRLNALGIKRYKQCLFACMEGDELLAQTKAKRIKDAKSLKIKLKV